jgi:predicted GIY-YIG superfamily endonuclease
MYYVYLLNSIADPNQIYIGYTANIANRLRLHNTGGSPHTAKYRPWNMIACTGFMEKSTAINFEMYLKSQSGRAFIAKRFLQK